jgi:hypothetical protein
MRSVIIFLFILVQSSAFACDKYFIKADKIYRKSQEASSVFKIQKTIRRPRFASKITQGNEKKYVESLQDYYDEIYNYRLQFNELSYTDVNSKAIIDHSNKLVEKMKSILEYKNIDFRIQKQILPEFNIEINYIEISPKYVDSNDSFELVYRLKNKLNTNAVTVHPLDNVIYHSHGFSDSSSLRVEIGVRSLLEQLIFDQVQVTTRHEFTHASFITKRAKGTSSIYNHSFISFGDKNLTSNGRYYKKYMSNEELYTYSNNAFWASDKLTKASNSTKIDIFDDLRSTSNYLSMNEDIFTQARQLSSDTIDSLGDIIAKVQDESLAPFFTFQGKNNKKVLSYLDAEYIDIEIGDERVVNIFLDDFKKEYFIKVYDVFENSGHFVISRETQQNISDFKTNYIIFLKNIERDFQKMNDLTAQVQEANKKLSFTNSMLFLDHNSAAKFSKSKYDKLMEQKLIDFRKDLRKMGMMAREDYKGFMKPIK